MFCNIIGVLRGRGEFVFFEVAEAPRWMTVRDGVGAEIPNLQLSQTLFQRPNLRFGIIFLFCFE